MGFYEFWMSLVGIQWNFLGVVALFKSMHQYLESVGLPFPLISRYLPPISPPLNHISFFHSIQNCFSNILKIQHFISWTLVGVFSGSLKINPIINFKIDDINQNKHVLTTISIMIRRDKQFPS